VYGLDGTLRSAPGLNDAFINSEVRLPQVRSEIWEGFVFVAFDAGLPPLASRLGLLGRQLANWGLGELRAAAKPRFTRYDFNWKVFTDECYHCQHLHRKTWHQMFPTPGSRIDYQTPLNDEANGNHRLRTGR
jgi:phenylpropionate dioxygenase-like ring-hydroxylating dioxygenase large terminal subunit